MHAEFVSDDPIAITVNNQPVEAKRWALDLTTKVRPLDEYAHALSVRDYNEAIRFEASFTLDRESYDSVLASSDEPPSLWTVEITTDHNPWHRTPIDVRSRLRKLRDGIWWTIRRRMLRRSLTESTTIVVPDCQIGVDEP